MVTWNVLGIIDSSTASVVMMCIQFLVAVLITIVIETPIIRAFKVAENKTLIRGVNIVTNILLNVFSLLHLYLRVHASRHLFGYEFFEMVETMFIPEFLLIPVVEALFYYYTYNKKRKWEDACPRLRVTLFASYVANIASFVVGTLLLWVITFGMYFLYLMW